MAQMKNILSGLLALLINRAFYAAVLVVAGALGMTFSVDAAIQIGGAVVAIVGFIMALFATPPKVGKKK